MADRRDTGMAAHAGDWEHVRASFHALNVRTIRLAIALGLSLANPRDVDRVIERPPSAPPQTDRRVGPDRRAGVRTAMGPERRVGALWDELRGLLVLRYGLQKRCLDEFGIDATRRLLAEVRAALQREGFAPGADGINLERPTEGVDLRS